jgi:hypothetical protein
MTETPRERKRNRVEVLQSLTCGAVGLLVAFDVINMRVPLYCLGQASDRVGDVFHVVTRLVRFGRRSNPPKIANSVAVPAI